MKRTFLLTLIFFIAITFVQGQNTVDKKKFHEFDFWLGEWNVYNKNDLKTIRAESFIQTVIDSFAIQENYSVIGGPYKGKSFNKYNPQLDRWEQFWVDNGGLSLFITGGLDENGRMVMSNESEDGEGVITTNQISWELLENGNVNQIWRSKKGDADWSILFDGIYIKKK